MKLQQVLLRKLGKINPLWFIGALVAFSFFYNLHQAPLFDVDEGRFSETTREMFERNDFISPYVNGTPSYDKPILIYWFQALSVYFFGINEFAFRFPSALFAALWVFSTFFFTRYAIDKKTALIAACITATAQMVLIIGRLATADALLNMLIAASMFDLYRYYAEDKKRYLYRSSVWIGLGFLTKGPIAILIPGVVTFFFFLSQKQLKRWFLMSVNSIAVSIFLLIILPWYVVQYLKEGQNFIQGFFFEHNVNRFLSIKGKHGGQPWYYIPILFYNVLPFTALLATTFRRLIPLSSLRDNKRDLFLWIWFFFVFIFFSICRTKLPHYILYGTTPLFILMAMYRETLKSRIIALLPETILFITILALPIIIPCVLPKIQDPLVQEMLQNLQHFFTASNYILLGILSVALIVLMFIKRLQAWRTLIIAGVLQAFVVTHLITPVAGQIMQVPVKEAALFAKKNGYENIVMWHNFRPSFSVYRNKSSVDKPHPEPGDVVFTSKNKVNRIDAPYEVLYSKQGMLLLRILE